MAVEYPLCRYRIDPRDEIAWVDEMWLAFARENGAAELTEERVLGRSLWDFVSDEVTRKVYMDIHARLRFTGNSAVLPFRCDSPSMRRHMQLTIKDDDSGDLMYDSLLLRAEPRRWLPLLESKRPCGEAVLMMCSCCKRAESGSLGWLDVEDAYVTLRIFEAPQAPELRYTLCPRCATRFEDPPLIHP